MTSTEKRVGNRRGFGGNLREEIIAAAERLLEESGSRDAVTLRGIAREAGIAAPSIYPHFADRDAILEVVISRTFEKLAAACASAADGARDGQDQLQAICLAYVTFARQHPGQYRILFERAADNIAAPPHPYEAGIQAFTLLTQALASTPPAPSASSDATADAQVLFATLHGIAALPPALPGFPWQDEATLIHHAVAKIRP